MTDGLFHPKYGFVWSLSLGSNAHGYHHQQIGCRCHWSSDIEAEDILAKCVFLREIANIAAGEVSP